LDVAGKQGDADSFNEMGRIWLNPVDESKLIKRDPGKAFAYISRAAEMGSVLGISNLGFLYLNGIGVTQNLAVARQLLEKAAQMGELNARALLLQNFGAQPVGESDKKRTNSDPKASASQVGAQSAATGVTMVEKVTERIIERVAERPVEKPSPVEIFSKSSPSVFTLIAVAGGGKEMSQGSAVAISNGVYVTNCHVIKDMTTYGAKIGGAVKLFRLLKGAPAKDVCIIGGDAGIPAISGTRKFQDLKVGEKVYAIGTPKGLANTFSEGLISGLRVIDGVKKVQTTASITNGSSGGALLDEFGRLVGITTSGMKEGNLNFAISADEVFELLGQ
jgi:S1-C subfamily serine protease